MVKLEELPKPPTRVWFAPPQTVSLVSTCGEKLANWFTLLREREFVWAAGANLLPVVGFEKLFRNHPQNPENVREFVRVGGGGGAKGKLQLFLVQPLRRTADASSIHLAPAQDVRLPLRV